MSLLYLPGPDFNLLRRGLVPTVTTGGADANYPIANVSDDDCAEPFRFNSLVANCAFKKDLDLLEGLGVLTTWAGGVPSGWTKFEITGGTVTQLSPGRGGAGSAARLNGGASGSAGIEKTFTALAGEWIHVEFYGQIAASGSAKCQIYNKQTNKFLNSSGAWTTSNVDFRVQNLGGGYIFKSGEFQVEAFGGSNPAKPTLRVTLYTTSNENVDVDDIVLYPGVNFGSIHGHNLDSVTSQLQHSTDNFVADSTTVATFTIARPAFYSYLGASMTYKQWWRFEFPGTNQAKIWLGEAVLGQAQTAVKPQKYGWLQRLSRPQIRHRTPTAAQYVYPFTQDEAHGLQMEFDPKVAAELADLRDNLYRRTESGYHPLVLVPYDADALVVHGRLMPDLELSHRFIDHTPYELVVDPSPLPRFGL